MALPKIKTNKLRPLLPFVLYRMVLPRVVWSAPPIGRFLFFKKIFFLWQVSADD